MLFDKKMIRNTRIPLGIKSEITSSLMFMKNEEQTNPMFATMALQWSSYFIVTLVTLPRFLATNKDTDGRCPFFTVYRFPT
jgi:hypothetical protein